MEGRKEGRKEGDDDDDDDVTSELLKPSEAQKRNDNTYNINNNNSEYDNTPLEKH